MKSLEILFHIYQLLGGICLLHQEREREAASVMQLDARFLRKRYI